MPPLPRVFTLFGPTASGKTGAALEIAERLGCEIVNADSRQIYTGMPLIAACPSADEYARAPHHLFEFLAPNLRYSAGQWAQAATEAAHKILARGQTPLLVGGTGFYLKTLLQGLNPVPTVPPEAEAALAHTPAPELHAQLTEADPTLAAKLHPNDTQRLTRALAVVRHTGTPLSVWQAMPSTGGAPFAFCRLALSPPRDVLHSRIALRWEAMLQQGVVEESLALRAQGYTPEMPGLSGLGIAEILMYADGALTRDALAEKVQALTRQYAKRQVTWLRHNYGADILAETPAELVAQACCSNI